RPYTTVDAVGRVNVARLNTDAPLDTSLDTGTGPSMAGRRDPYPRVRGLAIQADGKVLVGGGFSKFNGVPLNFLARLLADQGGTVEFTNANFSADENGGYATVSVRRTGSTNGTVSVNYLTRDGTATGTDYAAQAGALTFGPGETNQVFTVPIIPDSQVEPNETVNLVLANPIVGVILGIQKTATLTIIDNTNSLPIAFTSITNFTADQVLLTLSGQGGRTYVLQAATSL